MASCPQHNHLWQIYFTFSLYLSQIKGWILSVPDPYCVLLPCFQGYQLILCKSVSLPAQLSALHKLLFRPEGVHDWNLVARTPTEGSERVGRKSLPKWWFISMEMNSSNRPGKVGSTPAQQVTKALHGKRQHETKQGKTPWSQILSKCPPQKSSWSGHRVSLF